MRKKLATLAALGAIALCAPNANAVVLLAGNQSGAGSELFTIDTVSGVKTLIGNMASGSTEIEFDTLTGKLYSEGEDGDSNIYDINPATAATNSFAPHLFGAFNGLEYIGNVLYGTHIASGGGAMPSSLYTINPVTGATTLIGATGLGPITGLAYEVATGILYGSTNGVGGFADLVTINVAAGLATIVGSIGFDRVGSIEFGADGILYAGTSQGSSTPGALLSINTSTGAGTLLHTGFGSITGLTSVPEPTTLLLLGLGLAGLGFARRRLH